MYITELITVDDRICNGKPTIRGSRVTVQTILEFLKAGDGKEEILEQYPMLSSEDIYACLDFAVKMMEHKYSVTAIGKVA